MVCWRIGRVRVVGTEMQVVDLWRRVFWTRYWRRRWTVAGGLLLASVAVGSCTDAWWVGLLGLASIGVVEVFGSSSSMASRCLPLLLALGGGGSGSEAASERTGWLSCSIYVRGPLEQPSLSDVRRHGQSESERLLLSCQAVRCNQLTWTSWLRYCRLRCAERKSE